MACAAPAMTITEALTVKPQKMGSRSPRFSKAPKTVGPRHGVQRMPHDLTRIKRRANANDHPRLELCEFEGMLFELILPQPNLVLQINDFEGVSTLTQVTGQQLRRPPSLPWPLRTASMRHPGPTLRQRGPSILLR